MPPRPRLERDYTAPDEYVDNEDPRLFVRRRPRYDERRSRLHDPYSTHGESSSRRGEESQERPDAPNTSTELNKSVVGPPVEHHTDIDNHGLGTRQYRGDSARKQSGHQIEEPQEDYDIPNNYMELDKLAIPSPVENREDCRQDVLENRLSQGDSSRKDQKPDGSLDRREYNITEPVAPLRSRDHTNDPPARKESISHSLGRPIVETKNQRPRKIVSKYATELYTVSYLILFSILGTLARLGLQALTFYPGAPVQFGLLWANFGGSLLMGFLLEDRNLFRAHSISSSLNKNNDEENGDSKTTDSALRPYAVAAQKQASSKQHAAVKKTIPLYIGLTTGFCGSFTSFSSFIRDAYLALSNGLPVPISHISSAPVATSSTVPRNGGYSFMAICAVILVTVIFCLGALLLGAHLAIALEPVTPGIPPMVARRIVDRMVVFIAWTAWLGAVLMAIWPPDRLGGPAGQVSWKQEVWRGNALFALVFAPLGCLLRFYVSLHLNGKVPSFPLGTFAVNIFGTALEGMFYDLQHVPLGGRVGCQMLQGLMDGFCGCLTTVSTWVAELKGLRIRHAYAYGSVSVGVGVGLMVIIMGSFQWTMGLHAPLCGG